MSGANGGLVSSSSYDPYGKVIFGLGEETTFGYTGEQQYRSLDDMVYLRARYYAPTTGTFLSRDTWEGDANLPMSYNRWLYTYANPVNYADPSGMVTVDPDRARKLQNFEKGINKRSSSYNNMIGFLSFMDYAVSLYDDRQETDQFILDTSAVILAMVYDTVKLGYQKRVGFFSLRTTPDRTYFIGDSAFEKPINLKDIERKQYRDGGWRDVYKDYTGNQAYHFWYYVAVAYFDGNATAMVGNIWHELTGGGRSIADYYLGVKGRELGYGLKQWNLINKSENFAICQDNEIINKALKDFQGIQLSNVQQWIENNLADLSDE